MGTPFLIFYIGEFAGNLVQPFLVIRYLSISLVLLFLLFLSIKAAFFKSIIKSMRLLTTAHFVLMTIVGVFIAGHLNQANQFTMDINFLFDPPFWSLFTGNIAMFILTLFSIAFCWQYAVMINHVYDTTIDKKDNKNRIIPQGFMNENQVRQLAIIFALICLGLAFLVSIYALMLMLLGIFFGTIYSVPPMRLRDSVLSTMIIGIGSSIAFFLGYLTPQYVKQPGETATGLVRVFPEITTDAMVIGALIFIALTIGPLIKDYKDYQGDKKAGVKNLFTIYGVEKGVKITSALLPVPFFCLIILFHSLVDILIIAPLGILAGVLFYRLRNTKLVFTIYFQVILYGLLRWFELISF
jgi:4-hydroxybenzoate polyprenyltransferase